MRGNLLAVKFLARGHVRNDEADTWRWGDGSTILNKLVSTCGPTLEYAGERKGQVV